MSTLDAIILGIIEGITEFLPISSTGHMILVAHFLDIPSSVTRDTFTIIVQFGAILAVVVSFYKKLLDPQMMSKLLIGFIPTGIVGLIIFPYIKHLLQSSILVAIMLIIGGVIILLVERRYTRMKLDTKHTEITTISYKHAFILGLFQTLAIIPGVSRSGAMIVGGLLQGLQRKALIEFTFLLAVPTMTVAALYTLLKKHKELSLDSVSPIIIGTVIAFIVSHLVIRLALAYIRNHSFRIFGWYRIIAGIVLLIILL